MKTKLISKLQSSTRFKTLQLMKFVSEIVQEPRYILNFWSSNFKLLNFSNVLECINILYQGCSAQQDLKLCTSKFSHLKLFLTENINYKIHTYQYKQITSYDCGGWMHNARGERLWVRIPVVAQNPCELCDGSSGLLSTSKLTFLIFIDF